MNLSLGCLPKLALRWSGPGYTLVVQMNTPTTERPNTYIFFCFGSLLAHVPFANPRVGWTNPRVGSTSVYGAEPHNSFF